MHANRTLPRTAEPIGEGFFGVVWADGHESVFPAAYLRDRCPCAACIEARGREAPAPRRASLPVIGGRQTGPPALLDSEPVGRYAVRFRFHDGHDTGIFTFDLLRDICPCDACAPRPR